MTNDTHDDGKAELVDTLRSVASHSINQSGTERMRAALALAELLGGIPAEKRVRLQRIINGSTG